MRSRLTRLLADESPERGQHQQALEHYAPPSIIINERSIILHVSENSRAVSAPA